MTKKKKYDILNLNLSNCHRKEKNMGYDKNLEYAANTQTLIGQQKRNLVDMDTGEVITVDQITKRVYGTKNFWKCYLIDFLTVLGIMDSKQLDIFIYIVENTNQSNNTFLGTYKKIAAELNVSEPTIAKLFKKLQDKNFIKKLQSGAWIVNPNILMRGNDTKRQILLSYYQAEEPINEITYSRKARTEIPATESKNTTTVQSLEDKVATESNESQEIPAEAPKTANTAKKTTEKGKGKATTPKAPKTANKERKTTGQNKK